MRNLIKKLYDPKKCDDAKLAARFLFTEKVISTGAGMVLLGAIGGVAGVLACMFALAGAMPIVYPAVMLGAGLASFGIGLPVAGWGNSTLIDYIAEFKHRNISTPGKHPYVRFTPPPAPVLAAEAPVLAEIFDPAAAVTLKDPIRAMPAIKISRKGPIA